ncbi:MAG: flavodoxin [Spirochaetales bacterium]|nr:flavodoxin [Spirochaetales bacterium]
MKIAIFYGSMTGNTESAAKTIAEKFGGAECFAVDAGSLTKMADYDLILLGSSTWGIGDPEDSWDVLLGDLASLHLEGKFVSFFGMGNQDGFGDSYVDAMGVLKEALSGSGATFVGTWPTDGYSFTESKSLENGAFVGLALDDDNQPGQTDARIAAWVEKLQSEVA